MPDHFREPAKTMGPRSPCSDHSHSLAVKSGDDSTTFVHKKKMVENKLVSSRLHQLSSVPTSISYGISDATSGFSSDASSGVNNLTSPISICMSAKRPVYNKGSEQPQDFSVERFIEDSTSENKELLDDNLPLPLVMGRQSFDDMVEPNDGSSNNFPKNSSGYTSPFDDSGHDGEVEDNLDSSGGSSPVLQAGRYLPSSQSVQKREKEIVIPEVVLQRKVNHMISNTSVSSTEVGELVKRNSIQPNVTIEKVVSREHEVTKKRSVDVQVNLNESVKHQEEAKHTGEVNVGIKIKEFARFDTEVVDAGEMERRLLGPNNKYEQTLAALTGMSKRAMSTASLTDRQEIRNNNNNMIEGRQTPVEEDIDARSEVSSIDTWMSGTSYHSYMRNGLTNYYDDNMKYQMNQGSFPCTHCDKIFINAYHLNSHLVTHTGERSFSCPQCEKSFGRRSTLRAHMTTHSKTSNFMCPVCEKACNDNNSLEEHIRMHTGEKPFICTVCNKAYARKSHLSVHYRVHTGERPFVCVDCGKDFTEKRFLNDHMQTSHSGGAGGNDSGPLKCPNCYREFAYKTSLKQHLKKQMCVRNLARGGGNTNVQGSHTKQFACPFCDKSYSWKQTLKQHVSMYHRNKVHTDEFWKYEMAKHRRTVVDDKDRNDDMWQQQLGRYGSDTCGNSTSSNDPFYGEQQQPNNKDPNHDERWLQQIKRATSKDGNDKPGVSPEAKRLALQSLQSSLHSISSIYTNDTRSTEDVNINLQLSQKSPSADIGKTVIKEEAMDVDLGYPSIKSPKDLKEETSTVDKISHVFNKYPQQPEDNYLTLLAHLSTQRKACEEEKLQIASKPTKEWGIPTEQADSLISREKSYNQYNEPSQQSESLCSQKLKERQTPASLAQDINQDQRSSSDSPPTLSLPDIKEESSVTRTKMWLAQLGQYRQKAVQDEMEKSHDELWEEQISRVKHNPVKSPIEPLEITIEGDGKKSMAQDVNKNMPTFPHKSFEESKFSMDESSLSTENSSSCMSTSSLFLSKKVKHAPLISALQVQQAPTRAFKLISNANLPRNGYDIPQQPNKKLCYKMLSTSPQKVSTDLMRNSSSPRSCGEKMTPPPPPASPISLKVPPREQVSFKNLLSINTSTIVNVNGQNVRLGNFNNTDNQEHRERSSKLRYTGRISLSTPRESNNNVPPPQQLVQGARTNHEEPLAQVRHIPLAIPPLQPTSHLPPVAKHKHEKSGYGQENSDEDHNMKDSNQIKADNSKGIKPKYPLPDPNTFGTSSVLKMLLLDPSKRKRTTTPPPSPIQNKRSTYSPSNTSVDLQQNGLNSKKISETPNLLNRFSRAPSTPDETDILRRRLLGIKDSLTPPTTPSKSVQMLLPKPRYSPPSATITSADVAEKEVNILHKKSPMAVEEFTKDFNKVVSAAATLASFNLARAEDKQLYHQNTKSLKIIKKVDFPIEVNYEHYIGQDYSKSVLKEHKQQLLPTTQEHTESMLFEDDLKASFSVTNRPVTNRLNLQNGQKYCVKELVVKDEHINHKTSHNRKSQDSDNVNQKELRNSNEEDVVVGANVSAYSRTSVSKHLLYRYNNNNNTNNITVYNNGNQPVDVDVDYDDHNDMNNN